MLRHLFTRARGKRAASDGVPVAASRLPARTARGFSGRAGEQGRRSRHAATARRDRWRLRGPAGQGRMSPTKTDAQVRRRRLVILGIIAAASLAGYLLTCAIYPAPIL